MLHCQLGDNLSHALGIFRHYSCDITSCARENIFNSRRTANQDDRIARHTGFTLIIDLQECTVRQCRCLKKPTT